MIKMQLLERLHVFRAAKKQTPKLAGMYAFQPMDIYLFPNRGKSIFPTGWQGSKFSKR